MELSALKKEIHASVDELNDEQALLEIAGVLDKYELRGSPDYQDANEFKSQLDQAIK